ncbi:histidinol dehydrogenase [Shewanella marina]|uniref:histidinol dehydrogenase n=1 Tax=Shewanella marina TaxID=487319 RepID=UPI00046FF75E|nr:histidinol dehydrogenase [Shewanella marina]
MQIFNTESLDQTTLNLLARAPLVNDTELPEQVRQIIDKVKQNGDQALFEFAQQYDQTRLTDLKLSPSQITQACANVSRELQQAIIVAKTNIERFHQQQITPDISLETQAGVRCELKTEAIERVGLYIPGGSAPLISTVLMLAIPAQIAGCKQKILISPPPINDAIVYAATLCGIETIIQAGGAQAIAALAFGTQSVAKVDKIFGPGNRFVTEAKKQVSQASSATVTIDMPAGPSEVLVLADASANPAFVAADLLSQAEHGPDSQVMLATDSQLLAEQVVQQIAQQLTLLPRKQITVLALEQSRIFVTPNMQLACQISNAYAPEHLIIQTQNPRQTLTQIRAAGSVFLGAYTPESAGDYASGTNHVLPTYGYSKSVSSLNLADFQRRFTVQELTPTGLKQLGPSIMQLAQAERLDAHSNAVQLRLATLAQPSEGISLNEPINCAEQLVRANIAALKPYQSARRIGGQGDIWINANESPFNNSNIANINRYPEPQPPELIEAYSRYCGLSSKQVLVSRGADEAIELIIRCFCQPGQDAIALFGPTYGMYAISAETIGVDCFKLALNDEMQLPTDASIRASAAKVIFICNPNNPTGDIIQTSIIEELLQQNPNKLIVVDEAYIEFCPEFSMSAFINQYDNLIVLRTLSKAFALAGARVGFTLADSSIIAQLNKVIAPYPLPLPSSQLAINALSQSGIALMQSQVATLQQQGQILQQTLTDYGAHVRPSFANFILAEFDDVDAELNKLTQAGIIARHYQTPRLANAIRFSFSDQQQTQQICSLYCKG